MDKIERLTFGRVIVWNTPVAIQSDTDLASLLGLKLISVDFDGVGMCEDEVVSGTETKSTARSGLMLESG